VAPKEHVEEEVEVALRFSVRRSHADAILKAARGIAIEFDVVQNAGGKETVLDATEFWDTNLAANLSKACAVLLGNELEQSGFLDRLNICLEDYSGKYYDVQGKTADALEQDGRGSLAAAVSEAPLVTFDGRSVAIYVSGISLPQLRNSAVLKSVVKDVYGTHVSTSVEQLPAPLPKARFERPAKPGLFVVRAGQHSEEDSD
jgi:hypothetical protein